MSLGFPQELGWADCPPGSTPGSQQCPYPYPILARTIKRLHDAGMIMVAAAGNRNPRPVPLGTIAQGNGGDGNGGDGPCRGTTSLPPDEKTAQGNGGDGNGGDGNGGDGNGGDGNGGDGPTFCYKTTQVKVPAAYPWVIAVGATDSKDQVTEYSRSGQEMSEHGVTAPGGSRSRDNAGALAEGILSTNVGGGYGLGIGTSQAAAHVTGALALMREFKRDVSFKDVHSLLMRRGRSYGLPPEWEGGGLIDAERVVNALKRRGKNGDRDKD